MKKKGEYKFNSPLFLCIVFVANNYHFLTPLTVSLILSIISPPDNSDFKLRRYDLGLFFNSNFSFLTELAADNKPNIIPPATTKGFPLSGI